MTLVGYAPESRPEAELERMFEVTSGLPLSPPENVLAMFGYSPTMTAVDVYRDGQHRDGIAEELKALELEGGSEPLIMAMFVQETEEQPLELIVSPTRTQKALAYGREALTSLLPQSPDTDELPLDTRVENAVNARTRKSRLGIAGMIAGLAAVGMAVALHAGASSPSENHHAATPVVSHATYHRGAPWPDTGEGADPAAMDVVGGVAGGTGAAGDVAYLLVSGSRRRRYDNAAQAFSYVLTTALQAEMDL